MIEAGQFARAALERGYEFWAGVPCSFLAPFINYVIQSPEIDYFAASSEGEAVGIAAGAHFSGRKTVVMCQNSGLGNMVNPLTSLNYPFRIPALLIITQRGAPGVKDEPQHHLMGRITGDLLDTMGIAWESFPAESQRIDEALERAEKAMASTGLPYGFVMGKGAVADYPLKRCASQPAGESATPIGGFRLPPAARMARQEAIRTVRESLSGHEALVAGTGHIGRELYALGHRPNQLYVVGSLGCALGIGLGIHAGARNRAVVVLDGDGAILMKMGTLATVGYYRPKGLLHIILDNEAHESTGGQATASARADLAAIASACGYAHVWRVESPDDLTRRVREASSIEGPNLIHAKVALGSDPKLGRPDLSPVEVKKQFMQWLSPERERLRPPYRDCKPANRARAGGRISTSRS